MSYLIHLQKVQDCKLFAVAWIMNQWCCCAVRARPERVFPGFSKQLCDEDLSLAASEEERARVDPDSILGGSGLFCTAATQGCGQFNEPPCPGTFLSLGTLCVGCNDTISWSPCVGLYPCMAMPRSRKILPWSCYCSRLISSFRTRNTVHCCPGRLLIKIQLLCAQ